MRSIESKHYPLKTNYGVFYLKLTAHFDRNTGTLTSYIVNLGTRTNKCVQLSVPAPNKSNTTGLLMWVEAGDTCSLETYIKSGLAYHMTLLGITISRQLNPGLTRLHLLDSSTFDCKMPDGTLQPTSMKQFYFAFHGSTWYEELFGAKMLDNHDVYMVKKQFILHDPIAKPSKFSFINDDLNQILENLYKSTATWWEFFKAIETRYGVKKCTVLYPWLNHVPEINVLETPNWYIDLTDPLTNSKLPSIKFSRNTTRNTVNGGTMLKRNTRRQYKSRRKIRTYLLNPNIPRVQSYDYNTYLSN
jgi:hypothetical protein